MSEPGIVVVGAGIVGASVAYHLAGRGRAVTLVDAGLPASGATKASFAWIGRPVSSDRPSAALRYLAVDEYRRLETELPQLAVRWTGSLTWDGFDESPGPGTSDPGSLEPNLATPPPTAFHHKDDGALDPVAATETLVEAARNRGAQVVVGSPVSKLLHDGNSVAGIQTIKATIPAETVVLAAGAGSVALCAGIGIDLPVESSPAILVKLRTKPGVVRGIVATPALEARQLDDGTVLAPTAYSGETDQQALQATAERVRARFVQAFDGTDDAEVESVEIGWRPMPADDEPIIGRPAGTEGLYVAVMHSAITLAAAAGRLAADEILTGQQAPELAPCRPNRFH